MVPRIASASWASSWADAAACREPTAYWREASETCAIATTTWSEAERCCWVAIEISRVAMVVSSTMPAIRSRAVAASWATPRARSTSRWPSSLASTVAPDSAPMRVTRPWIWVVEARARSASRRTSAATTAKPWPCSPARAASIAAFSASRFVRSDRSSITSRMRPISRPVSPSPTARSPMVPDPGRHHVHGGDRRDDGMRPSSVSRSVSVAARATCSEVCAICAAVAASSSMVAVVSVTTLLCSVGGGRLLPGGGTQLDGGLGQRDAVLLGLRDEPAQPGERRVERPGHPAQRRRPRTPPPAGSPPGRRQRPGRARPTCRRGGPAAGGSPRPSRAAAGAVRGPPPMRPRR